MQSRVLIATSVLLATVTVAQGRRWFAPELSCWITQEKVPASWEDAQRRCEMDGAVLASPLNLQLFNYMQSLIDVHNHSAAYFIGTRTNGLEDGQKAHYVSVEGKRLDDMPRAVFDAIDQLDLEQGNCLCMDRHGVRAVSCFDHLPYICYSNETAECGSALTTTQAPRTTMNATTASTSPPSSTIPPALATTQAPSTSEASTTASIPTTNTSTPPSTSTTVVPPGYRYHPATRSWYKIHESLTTWFDANTACAREGAHMVVLNDAEEASIVAGSVRGLTWIGLRDNRPGGVMDWRTVNGEPVSEVFHEWAIDQPENDVRETCAVLYANVKLLHDYSCDRKFYYTCEISQKSGAQWIGNSRFMTYVM